MFGQSGTMHQKTVCLALAYSLLFAPLAGCSRDTDVTTAAESSAGGEGVLVAGSQVVADEGGGASGPLDQAWDFVARSTSSGLTVVSAEVSADVDIVFNASQAAWIWSADTTADGWGWIVANAGDATQWASDRIGNTWAVTRQAGGEFSLWVQVRAENGVAWAKTELPAAWQVTRDKAGNAWIWIDDHKVELAVAAAVIAVVVAALLIAPEGVAGAVARGVASGVSAEGSRFLAETWDNRKASEHGKTLKDVSKDLFLSLGRSVITQCGGQIASSLPVSVAG